MVAASTGTEQTTLLPVVILAASGNSEFGTTTDIPISLRLVSLSGVFHTEVFFPIDNMNILDYLWVLVFHLGLCASFTTVTAGPADHRDSYTETEAETPGFQGLQM